MIHYKEVPDSGERDSAFAAVYKNIENMQKSIIDRNPSAIKDMSASYEVVKYAVRRWGFNIKYINNPTEELQLIAIRYNPSLLRDIKNPTINVIREAILICDISQVEEYLSMLRSRCTKWDVQELVTKRPEIVVYLEPDTQMILRAISSTNNVCFMIRNLKLHKLSVEDRIEIYITAVNRDKTAICFIPNTYQNMLVNTFGPKYFTEKEE